MSEPTQAELPGTQATMTRITGMKMFECLLDTGAQGALTKLRAELQAAQKQHPSAVGLTLALALIEREIATRQLATTRVVLAAAAKAGLDFDGKLLTSGIEGDALVVRATAEPLGEA